MPSVALKNIANLSIYGVNTGVVVTGQVESAWDVVLVAAVLLDDAVGYVGMLIGSLNLVLWGLFICNLKGG